MTVEEQMSIADTHERLGYFGGQAAFELSSPSNEKISMNRDTLFTLIRILHESDRPLDARWLVREMLSAVGITESSPQTLLEMITDAIVKGG